jgi:hypothetical protein
MSSHTDIARFLTVLGRLIAGAFGRSESALAFSIGSLRMIDHIPVVGYRQTPGSFAGATFGIAWFDHILPIRTLGAQWRWANRNRCGYPVSKNP